MNYLFFELDEYDAVENRDTIKDEKKTLQIKKKSYLCVLVEYTINKIIN